VLWRALVGMVLMVLVEGGVSAPVLAAVQSDPAPDLADVSLQENDCSFLIQFEDDPRPSLGDMSCGWLDVPENWSEPDGRRLQIGYVVLHSTSPTPEPDPVVYLDGGPGGSPLTGVTTFADLFAGLRASRDVLLFDQRGTRLSSPLRCQTLGAPAPEAGDAPAPDPAADGALPLLYPDEVGDGYELLQFARQEQGPITSACAREIEAAGVDLRQYNSIASANDAVSLVKALGYDTYNLYGISYGTRLALVVMRDHPRSGLRSVVLDSSFPPEINGFERFPQEPHEVVIQVFADCALDAACHVAYPNLKARFVALLDRLAAEPIVTPDGDTITDRDLVQVMQGLTGQIAAVPYVPRMIAELERGEYDTIYGIATGALFADSGDVDAVTDDAALAATPMAEELPADASPARLFLHEIQVRIDRLPEDESDALIGAMLNLDLLPPDRDTLVDFAQRAFPDDPEAVADLLSLVAAMDEADVQEVFAIVADTVSLLDFLSFGMTLPQFNSVECNEELPFQSFDNTVAIAQSLAIPQMALGVVQNMAKQFAICEVWPSGRAPGFEELAVASDVPTLIMAGAYDLQTPVSWNKSAFVNLANGFFVEFPMSGHGVITYSECAEEVAAAFVADPVALPDTSCVAALKPVWVLPENQAEVIATPVG
jgi:pimeloyl-ACP methyl ester carboxylesterase